jgi:hypothetical protein
VEEFFGFHAKTISSRAAPGLSTRLRGKAAVNYDPGWLPAMSQLTGMAVPAAPLESWGV